MRIQEKITIRSLELLDLKKKDGLILDAGCAPWFAAIYLNELGYKVVALDLISEFLSFYNINELNPIAADMCFLPFQPNTFYAIISIFTLQWIYRELNNDSIKMNLVNLAYSIEILLKPKSRAIVQFYPKNNLIMEAIGKIIAENTKLKGTYIINNPNNAKKRKIFLLFKKEFF